MANRYDGGVDVRLDRVRKLKFDLNALAEFEGVMGYTMNSLFIRVRDAAAKSKESAASIIGFREIRALLWSALLYEEEKLTLRQAGELVSQADGDSLLAKIDYITPKILEAYVAFQGPEAKKKFDETMRTMLESPGTGPISSE